LESYEFPGNVRELKNLIERLCILVTNQEITDKDVFPHLRNKTGNDEICDFMTFENFSDARREFETRFITEKLKQSKWNITTAAEKLGMRQPNLSRKMKELKISRID